MTAGPWLWPVGGWSYRTVHRIGRLLDVEGRTAWLGTAIAATIAAVVGGWPQPVWFIAGLTAVSDGEIISGLVMCAVSALVGLGLVSCVQTSWWMWGHYRKGAPPPVSPVPATPAAGPEAAASPTYPGPAPGPSGWSPAPGPPQPGPWTPHPGPAAAVPTAPQVFTGPVSHPAAGGQLPLGPGPQPHGPQPKPPSAAPGQGPDRGPVEQLSELARLHQAGALTEEEFAAAKARVLHGH